MDLLIKSIEDPTKGKTIIHFLNSMSAEMIVANLSGTPFEELKQRIKEYI